MQVGSVPKIHDCQGWTMMIPIHAMHNSPVCRHESLQKIFEQTVWDALALTYESISPTWHVSGKVFRFLEASPNGELWNAVTPMVRIGVFC